MSATSGQAENRAQAVAARDTPSAGEAAPRPRRLGLALTVIATAQLMVVLDRTATENSNRAVVVDTLGVVEGHPQKRP